MSSSAKNQPVTRADLDAAVETLTRRLDGHDQRFDGVDRRFEQVDRRFEQVDRRFDRVELRLDALDVKTDALDAKIDAVERRLSRHISSEVSRAFGLVEERFVHYFDLVMERLDQHCNDARLHPALNDMDA